MNELTVHQEGSSVRAIAGRLNFLFLRSSTEVIRTIPPESQEASEICARLMGISVDAYREWREGYESSLRMW